MFTIILAAIDGFGDANFGLLYLGTIWLDAFLIAAWGDKR